jgi:hypothetical protein
MKTTKKTTREPDSRKRVERPAKRRTTQAAPPSPRARLVTVVEELQSVEARLEAVFVALRSELERSAASGAIAAGGYDSVDELLASTLGEASPLSPLSMPSSEPWPPCARGGCFAAYAALLDAIEAHESEAKRLVKRARGRLATLERGAYRTGGYRSFEELLERVVVGFPRLAGALLVAEQAELRARPGPTTGFGSPAPVVAIEARRSGTGAATSRERSPAWARLRGRALGIVAVASMLALLATVVVVRAQVASPARPTTARETAAP